MPEPNAAERQAIAEAYPDHHVTWASEDEFGAVFMAGVKWARERPAPSGREAVEAAAKAHESYHERNWAASDREAVRTNAMRAALAAAESTSHPSREKE